MADRRTDEPLYVAVSMRDLRDAFKHSCGDNCPIEQLAIKYLHVSARPAPPKKKSKTANVEK